MKTKNYFKIEIKKEFEGITKKEEIEFFFEINEDGEISDEGSFNPTTGWTSYTNWNQGWSEQDEDLNELISNLKQFQIVEAMWIEDMVSEMDCATPIKKHRTYNDCKITFMAQDVIYYDKEGEEVTPTTS